MKQSDILDILNDPVSQALIKSDIPARVAYTGTDGFPRAIPIAFHWDGEHFVMCSPPDAPKVKALQANPGVALTIDTNGFPPNILLVRGTTTIDVVEGVAPEFLEASRRRVPTEQWDAFEVSVRQLYKQMARITIVPEWAKVMDFVTRFPGPVARRIEEA